MRHKRPPDGKKRIRKRFLVFPKTIKGETRWLEEAMWEEEVDYLYKVGSGKYWGWRWSAKYWLSDDFEFPIGGGYER